jgi:hypothetical protein
VQAELGRSLPATVVFDFPNVETLARFLITDVFQLNEPSPDSSPSPQAAENVAEDIARNVDELRDLSEAELADLLIKKLASMT